MRGVHGNSVLPAQILYTSKTVVKKQAFLKTKRKQMNKRVQPKYLREIFSFLSQGETQGSLGVEVKAWVKSQLIPLFTV